MTDRNRDSSGRYAEETKCDCCGKPVDMLHDGRHFTDDEVCSGGDGPGFYLCHRSRCQAKQVGLSVEQRRVLFTAQRALNYRGTGEIVR